MISFDQHFSRIGLAILVFLFSALTPSFAAEQKNKALISLTGVGKISASPDIVKVTSGVVSQAKTAAKALQANSAAMTRIIAGLKAANIASRDIQTSGFSVNPNFFYDRNNGQNQPKIIGYQVRNQVQITVRQRDSLGLLLDTMIALGANQINNISFAIDKPQALEDEARKLAYKDALRKAEIYMTATNAKLGRIISISEGQLRPPTPRYAARAEAARDLSVVPIEAGERTVSIQLNITWELE